MFCLLNEGWSCSSFGLCSLLMKPRCVKKSAANLKMSGKRISILFIHSKLICHSRQSLNYMNSTHERTYVRCSGVAFPHVNKGTTLENISTYNVLSPRFVFGLSSSCFAGTP